MDTIYTIEEVEFKVGKEVYDVSSISLNLSLNEIPNCEVMIAPSNAKGDVKVNALELYPLREAYKKLYKAALKLEKVSLHLKVKISDDTKKGAFTKEEQELDLKEWVLTHCSLSNLSTTGIFYLVCSIYHPSYCLTTLNGVFVNSANTIKLETTEVEAVNDPINAGVVALTTINNANENSDNSIKIECYEIPGIDTTYKNGDEIAEEFKTAQSYATERLQKFIKWDPAPMGSENGIPYDQIEGIDDDHKYGIKYAMTQAWLGNMSGNSTVWDVLINTICPWFWIQVIPSFTNEQLIATPTNPWSKVAYKLSSCNAYYIDMPGFDPAPVYGATMSLEVSTSALDTSVVYVDEAGEGSALKPVDLIFIPNKADVMTGSMIQCSDPPWIDLAMSKAASHRSGDEAYGGNFVYTDESSEPDAPPTASNEDIKVWNTVRLCHLANTFMSSYKERCSVTIKTCLQLFTEKYTNKVNKAGEIDDSSKKFLMFIPGYRANFVDLYEETDEVKKMKNNIKDGEKQEVVLFTGLVTGVNHTINCANGDASTTISMSYCDVDGVTSEVIGKKPSLPVYCTRADSEYVDLSGAGNE